MDSTSLLIASFQNGAYGEVTASLNVQGSFSNIYVKKLGPKDVEVLCLLLHLGSSSIGSLLDIVSQDLLLLSIDSYTMLYGNIFSKNEASLDSMIVLTCISGISDL